ncbi:MAG: hypothetical protein ACJ790_06755 [Myxococcaceae bacterium]
MQLAKDIPLFENGTQEHWQRREMVIALLDGAECPQCSTVRARLNARRAPWLADNVAVVSVLLDEPHAAELGRAFGSAEPLIGMANRFGSIYASLPVHGEGLDSVMRAVDEWIDLAQRQLCECQAPARWD